MKNKTKFILLIEDNPDDELLTIQALKDSNISNDVIVARDGEEALDFLFGTSKYLGRDLTLLPQVTLLDIKLPKLDGLEVLQQIRANKNTKLLPVVMLTSSKEEQDLIHSYELGANSYIRKPVDFDQFTKAIQNLLTINHLKENDYDPFYKIVFSLEALKELLVNGSWDCVISDYAMPNFTGLEALDEFIKHKLEIPFILLSGTIMKDYLALLGPALDRELLEAETRRQNKQKDKLIRASEKLLRKKNIEIELQNEELRQINDKLNLSMLHLKESEAKFKAITNLSLDGHCFVNPMFCIITGFSSIELLKMTVNNLNSPSLLKLFLNNNETLAGKYLETVMIRKDGIEVTIEVIGNLISVDNQPLVVGTIRDITARKQAEKALLETERFSRATLDALSENIAVLNEQGEIIFENKAWRDFGADNSLLPKEKRDSYNYLNICDSVSMESKDYKYAKATADGIRAVIVSEIQKFELEYPCDLPTEEHWFNMCVTRFEGEGPVFVTVSHDNIT